MAKQKKITELLKPCTDVVNAFFTKKIEMPNGLSKEKMFPPEDYQKETKASGFTVRGLMKGKINKLDKLISIVNACGWTVDEIKISKIEDNSL